MSRMCWLLSLLLLNLTELRKEEDQVARILLRKGNTTGRLVVTTAIKDSLIDHDPASWAPLIGS